MQQQNIKIVMVGTTHPGNIGAAARAMHNTCFSRLCLVDPQCPVGEIAYARASGANRVLDERETHGGLAEAIAECELVVALSARRRSVPWPELDTRQLRERVAAASENGPVAVVFGREHSGLSNDELQLCHCMHAIPANPEFSSMNVAAAIQVICYELFRGAQAAPELARLDPGDRHANSGELEAYFAHLQRIVETTGFVDPQKPGQIMTRLRRLFLRSELTQKEINILRGILAAIERRLD